MPKTILAIGGIYVDINCHGVNFSGSMPAEVKIDGAEYELIAGGSSVNFGRLCKQLGLEPAFIGKVGDDPMGDLALQLLTEAGIQPLLITDGTFYALRILWYRSFAVFARSGDAFSTLHLILEHLRTNFISAITISNLVKPSL